MKIKAIYADLGGVLIINKAREVGEKYEKSDGLTPKMTKNAFRFIQTAKRSDEELATYLNNKNIKIDVWKRFLADFYASESRNDSLIELLEKAKKKGKIIIFTTNNSSNVSFGIKKYGISHLADGIVNSSDLKIAKPDKKFWIAAFRQTKKLIPNIHPENVLVIDDSEKNCASAKDFGFNSFVYKNRGPDLLTGLFFFLHH
ncbi:HAD family hydrolase [Patescibacteria group bacterium]|nr:HAD family hydrolase [Patescibacteria group bacterium]